MVGVKRALPMVIVAASLFFSSCSKDGPIASGGTGTETGNALYGKILYGDGSPASGVSVQIFPVDFVPLGVTPKSSSVIERMTDANGLYDASDLGIGMYNVEGRKDTLGVFVDTIIVDRDSAKCRVPDGVMAKLGMISGRTLVQGFSNPDSLRLMIYFPGTGRILKPVIGDFFRFDSMPAGPYRIVIDPSLVNFNVVERDLVLEAGEAVHLDTIILTPR